MQKLRTGWVRISWKFSYRSKNIRSDRNTMPTVSVTSVQVYEAPKRTSDARSITIMPTFLSLNFLRTSYNVSDAIAVIRF